MTANDPAYRSLFGGITSSINTGRKNDIQRWYRQSTSTLDHDNPIPTFRECVTTLSDEYGAETLPAYYYDEDRGEYIEAPEQSIIVNPAWLGDGLENAPEDSAAWAAATDQYETVVAAEAYEPLINAAEELDYTDVFGLVEAYRNGGQVVIEVLFDDMRVTDRETGKEFILGFETGYDHFRRSSVWATLLAYDCDTGAALRGLSQRFSQPHRGDPSVNLTPWYEDMIDRADRLGDHLYQVIAEARNYTIEMSEVPVEMSEWYQHLGYPETYADDAAQLVNKADPSAFDVYMAVADTITYQFDGKTGGKMIREYASTANEILFSPDSAEEQALKGAKESIVAQQTLSDNDRIDIEQLNERIGSLDEGVAAFTSFRDRIETMLEDLEDPDPDSDPDHAQA